MNVIVTAGVVWVLLQNRGPWECSTRILNWRPCSQLSHLVIVLLVLFVFSQCSLPVSMLMGMLAAISCIVGFHCVFVTDCLD